MSKKRNRSTLIVGRSDDRAVQAKQVDQWLQEYIAELEGTLTYTDLVARVIRRAYPDHKKLVAFLAGAVDDLSDLLIEVRDFHRRYRSLVADYEHRQGKIDCPRLRHIDPYMTSITELLDLYPMDEVVEDFLDG